MQALAIINTLIATAERLEEEAGRLRKEATRLETQQSGPVSTGPSISQRTTIINKRMGTIKKAQESTSQA